jgi:GDP-L-fucose synthase
MIKKVLVTGGTGLVGSAIAELQTNYSQYKFIFSSRQQYNLTRGDEVKRLFEETQPDYVIHTAARTGGVGQNLNSPARQYYDNVLINTHIIHFAHLFGIKRLLVFSSVTVFPADVDIMREDLLHEGIPHSSIYTYAYSKRMMDVQIQAYAKQYGTSSCSIIAGNIFGERDNFNIEDGHVVPSLIHKCFVAKQNNTFLQAWGDGTPYREFIYSKDIARISIALLDDNVKLPPRMIVSGKIEIQIKDLINKICDIFGYHKVKWMPHKTNGQLRRTSDKQIFNSVFPSFKYINLMDALEHTIRWFEENYPNIRT